MKKYSLATDAMLKAVKAYLTAGTDITAGIPQIATLLTSFTAKVTEIDDLEQTLEQPLKGIRENKVALKKELAKFTKRIAGAIFAYATSQNDLELQGKTKFPLSYFLSQKDAELPNVCQNIYELANGHVTSTPNPLANYGMTSGKLTAFLTLISEYTNTITVPRTAITQRATYNQQLPKLIKEAADILKLEMDNLILQLEPDFPEFVAGYNNIRKTIDPKTMHSRVSGTITDAATKLPIAGVSVVALSTRYAATSDNNGNYSIDLPNFRISYTLIFTRTGYLDTKQMNVTVRKGKATQLDLTMNAST